MEGGALIASAADTAAETRPSTTADSYSVFDMGADRAMTRDLLSVASTRHHIHGLLEFDVTRARAALGELSMTAFLIHCFASALAREPRLNSAARGRRLYCFETVNVGTMIEIQEAARPTVAGIVIRDAAALSVQDIHRQIRSAQQKPANRLAKEAGLQRYRVVPGFLRRVFIRYLLSHPVQAHAMGLLAGVTAVGMFSQGSGWGLPLTPSTTMLTIGGISPRPVLIDGRIENREFVSITLSFDHDVVDGAPAARFAARFRRLVEQADGLS